MGEGGGGYHVESNYWNLGLFVVRRDGIAHDASRRARQDGLEAGEVVDIDKPAIALHELASSALASLFVLDALRAEAALEARLEAIDVLFDGGRQVGVCADGRCSGHELHHGHELVAEGDVLEANLPCDAAYQGLVVGERVSVHQTHGYAADAGVIHFLQLVPDVVVFGASQDPDRLAGEAPDEIFALRLLRARLSVRLCDFPLRVLGIVLQRDALVNLDDLLIQDVGLPDGQVKDLWPGLVANGEAVAEAARDDHGNLFAFALQQGVCGHGGAHADGVDVGGVEGLAAGDVALEEMAHDAPDALERRVVVVGRVFGQELDDDFLAAVLAHAVGEGAAAVDGYANAALLLGGCCCCCCCHDG